MTSKKLESLAYRLKDLASLRDLFSELNYDFEDKPVNKDSWTDQQKRIVVESKIIASKNDYRIYYVQTDTDSIKQWKEIATKIIKDNNGFAMVCSHNPERFNWVFSSLSKDFSKSFSETRHVPIDIKPDVGVSKTFVEFLESIRVVGDSTASSIARAISDAFDSFAIQIHEELTVNVFEALKILAEGIILDKSNGLVLDEQTLEEIREPTFILLYRIMFVLYAEDRAVFPESTFYYENFSLKWIKDQWILRSRQGIDEYQVQERLKKLFRLVEMGSKDLNYDPKEFFMRSYYGRLFDREIHHKLEKWNIPNKNLLSAISLLTRTRDRNGNYFFLDYAALETRHLGAIYEHLLEFHLTVSNGRVSDLPDAKERKSSGSYYTPKYIVDYIVENSVGPLIDEITEKTDDPGEQIDRILDLNILDPAMGSGHFLVGTTNYIAQRICQIEYKGREIPDHAIVERKRDVVRRCVYGVDLNPLAVDLAAVALWLETLSSEKPLSFLSAHLKTGNSLIGSSIEDILAKQTTIIESTTGRSKFKKNVRNFIMLEALEDDTAQAVKAKVEKYGSMQKKGTIHYDLKCLLDAKVAKEFGIGVPPIGDYVAKIGENGLDFYSEGSSWPEVRRAALEHSFFHWDLEFPDIFYGEDGRRKNNPGFDAVVGNPPWQIVKPDVDEFFAPLYNQQNNDKFSMLTKNKKNKFVADCMKDKKIKNNHDLYNRHYETQMKYFNSDAYHVQTSLINGKKQSSDLNMYKLFMEKSYTLLIKNGLCGFVVPSGIYSDLGTKGLREMLLEKTRIKSLYSFINKKGIFKGIHKQFKFCLIVFIKGGYTNKFSAGFYLEDASILQNLKETAYDYNVKHIQTMSPNSLSFVECKNKAEFEIFKKLYVYSLLGSDEWEFEGRREFDMTNDSNLFHTTKVGYPLYEGKMIYQFEHSYEKPRYWIEESEGRAALEKKERNRTKKINKNIAIRPRIDCDEYRLVWRDVSNAVDRRTLICTVLPPNVFLGNTLSYIRPIKFDGEKYSHSLSYKELIFLCGLFNSFPIDFILRHRINLHVNIFHLMELPIPKFDDNNPSHQRILKNTLTLISTTNEFKELCTYVGSRGHVHGIKNRLELISQINAHVCKIYNLNPNDLKFLLESFRVEDENLKKMTLKELIKLE